MAIGFTGTRHGMTLAQKSAVRAMLNVNLEHGEIHHGDCIGADAEANDIAGELRLRRIVHPPVDEKHRAHVIFFEEMREPKEYRARNRDIVDETAKLIAAPYEAEEQPRGGTWGTIRYALKQGKRVAVVYRDGRVQIRSVSPAKKLN